MKTKIYYDNGDRILVHEGSNPPYVGKFTPLSGISKNGVIALVTQHPETGWVLITGYEYYVWKNERWFGSDFYGLIDFLREGGYIDYGVGWKKIHVAGTWIDADLIDMYAHMENACPVLFGRWTSHEEYRKILQEAENDREFGRKNGYLQSERIVQIGFGGRPDREMDPSR
jgi:hypothetical protein